MSSDSTDKSPTPELQPNDFEHEITEFIVHQKHHYGWTTNMREAECAETAAYQDVLAYHDFLTPENHTWKNRHDTPEHNPSIVIRETTVRRIFGGWTAPGDHWFSSEYCIGETGDCGKCAGTGKNFYYPWKQCWACGDQDEQGVGTGKAS